MELEDQSLFMSLTLVLYDIRHISIPDVLRHTLSYLAILRGVSMFDPTREHDTNPTRVFSG